MKSNERLRQARNQFAIIMCSDEYEMPSKLESNITRKIMESADEQNSYGL